MRLIGIAILALFLGTPCLADTSMGQAGKEISQGIKKIGKDTGKAFKEGGREVGQGFKTLGRETGQALKEGGQQTGQATQKAGRSLAEWFRDQRQALKAFLARR